MAAVRRDLASDTNLSHSTLRTPRAAAVAGILFSLLLTVSMVLIRTTVPASPEDHFSLD